MTVKSSPARALLGHAISRSTDALIDATRLAVLLCPILLSLPQTARAAETRTVSESIDEEEFTEVVSVQPTGAQFGPFTVVDEHTVEMRGATDADSPAQFRAMIARNPDIRLIRMIDCAGTLDDEANFAVARMIRARGINTFVPNTGSIRSGGVELFVAGARHAAEPGAEFGVHSWRDEDGNEAGTAPANDPVHAAYINYYTAMGLPAQTAKDFYAFTNATRHAVVHYMTAAELARFGLLN